jgi:tetratricopeptide (TPR) repeat protein
LKEGATGEARRNLLQLIGQKGSIPFRFPAFRKLIDLTLRSSQFDETLTAFMDMGRVHTDNERDEIAYLKGKALMQLGAQNEAASALESISRSSRFRAQAIYLQGLLALSIDDLELAVDKFCRLVRQPGRGKYTFFVSEQADRVIEQAWLALARLRHDQGEHARAVDTYLRIAPGSPSYPESRYECAWSLYALKRFPEARRLLEDLLNRFERFPDRPVAQVLLGYSLLGDCRFDEAASLFEGLERVLMGLARTASAGIVTGDFSDELSGYLPVAPDERQALALAASTTETLGRLSRMASEFSRIGSGMPEKPIVAPWRETQQGLRTELSRARHIQALIVSLRSQLPEGLQTTAQTQELDQLESEVRTARDQAEKAEMRLSRLNLFQPWLDKSGVLAADAPRAYLGEEQNELQKLSERALALEQRASAVAKKVREGRSRRILVKVQEWLRLAALGRIDASIGQKQILEAEVQSLALGRFVPSQLRELARQGRLDESFEYWPDEGEEWPDETR